VYYSPLNPLDAVLDHSIRGKDLFPTLFILPFNIVMVGAWWVLGYWLFYFRKSPIAGGVKIVRELSSIYIKINARSPTVWAAMFASIACAPASLIFGIGFGFSPPLTLVAIAWAIVLCGSVLIWRKVNSYNQSGCDDIILIPHEGTISFIDIIRREAIRTTIEIKNILSIVVREAVHTDNEGEVRTYFLPTIIWRDHHEEKEVALAQWLDLLRANAFVEWLLKELQLSTPPPCPKNNLLSNAATRLLQCLNCLLNANKSFLTCQGFIDHGFC
jgi:hypothetical protein